jgi:hypothetical protein
MVVIRPKVVVVLMGTNYNESQSFTHSSRSGCSKVCRCCRAEVCTAIHLKVAWAHFTISRKVARCETVGQVSPQFY